MDAGGGGDLGEFGGELGGFEVVGEAALGFTELLLLILALTVVMGGGLALAVLVLLGVTFAFLRRLMVKRLGGTTGDTAGALLEVLELMTLVGWVVFSN